MNPVWGHLIGVVIAVLMVSFIGIWIWAWLPHHRNDFDALARMPMRDDGRSATEPGDEA
jgi:cytochrome c oxidase cbb3-type subunit 4